MSEDEERPEEDLNPIPEGEVAKEPAEAPGLPFEAPEPEKASETPEVLKPSEAMPDSPELPNAPVVVSEPSLEPLIEEPGKPIGIEPVLDEPIPPPVVTRQPVESLRPQSRMSLEARTEDWKVGGEVGPRPGRSAEEYRAGEYAQHPEPEMPEDAGRGPGMPVSDPFDLADKPPPPAPPEPEQVTSVPVGGGIGSTDALADAVKEGNKLLERLTASADMLLAEISVVVDKLDSIESALSDQDKTSNEWT